MGNRLMHFFTGNEHVKSVTPKTDAVATRAATTYQADPNETLGSITTRAYGVNSDYYRHRIEQANTTLDGQIVIPK